MSMHQSLLRALRLALILAITLISSVLYAKTFVLPHIIESSGSINKNHSFDSYVHLTYGGDLDSGSSAAIYLYDGSTGELLRSSNGTEVCAPCEKSLGALSRKVKFSVEEAVGTAGGFPGGVKSIRPFAVVVTQGDTDNIDVSEEISYINSGPNDLSLTALRSLRLRESPTLPSRNYKTFVLPHILESSGRALQDTTSFDMEIVGVYTGGLPGVSSSASDVSISLYLYDDNSSPMVSSTGNEVCNPCQIALSSSTRRDVFRLEDLIVSAGGFDEAYKTGFAILVVAGDADNAALQGFVVNSHTNAFDLSVFGFEPQPLVAASRSTKISADVPGLAKSFSGAPNPTDAGVSFSINLRKSGPVSLDLYTLDGRRVANAFQGKLSSGASRLHWLGRSDNGIRLAPGTYLARLTGDEGTQITRIVMLR